MNYRIALMLLSLASGSALAQDNSGNDMQFGVGMRNRPTYDGSDQQTSEFIPVAKFSYAMWFVRSTHGPLEGGIRIQPVKGLQTGIQLAHEAGPQDGDSGASLGVHLEWSTALGPMPINTLVRIRNHLDSDYGRLVDVRATFGIFASGGLRVGLFGQATWADEEYLFSYYAVNDSGLLYTSAGLQGAYQFDPRWSMFMFAEQRRLASVPAESTLVQDRSNVYIMSGLMYRF